MNYRTFPFLSAVASLPLLGCSAEIGELPVEEQPWELLDHAEPGETIEIGGLELVVPEAGVGVVTEVLREDGSTELMRIETTDEGDVLRFADGAEWHEEEAPVVIAASGSPACRQGAYSHMGFKWTRRLDWYVNYASRPGNLSIRAVRAALRNAVRDIVWSRNGCGLPDQVSATSLYQGGTSRRTGIDARGVCVANDGVSVVDFGALPAGTLAVNCTYYSQGRALAADIKFNRSFSWYTGRPPAGCANRFSLRSVATHERGHSFGLGHVAEPSFPKLTMSTHIAPCDNSATSLGWGDVLGLRRLY